MFKSIHRNFLKFKAGNLSLVIFFILFIGLSLLNNVQIRAQGNLLVDPHRIIFEGQKKIMNVSLINNGKDSTNYSISFLQYRMTDDGDYEEITTPDSGQNFADKYIHFFPHSVILGPNETQVVKLQLLKSEELQSGEYRSHLYFRALPKQKALGEEETKKVTSDIIIKIVPIFGISIPILIRVGESTTVLNITDLKVEKSDNTTNRLLLTIHRTGNMSVVFDISVKYIAQNGKETQIGLTEGTVVYTPNSIRKFKIELDNKPTIDLSIGKLRVVCTTKNGNNIVKLAEAEVVL